MTGTSGRSTQAGLNDDVVYSIARRRRRGVGRQAARRTDAAARGDGGSFTAERFTQADGLAQDSVYAVHQARDGAVWAGTLSGGASRFKDGASRPTTPRTGWRRTPWPRSSRARDGTMWFGTPNGLSALSRGGWRRYATGDGLPSNDVNIALRGFRAAPCGWARPTASRSSRAGQLAGAGNVAAGAARLDSRLPKIGRGWLWIATADRVFRVHREGLTLHGVRRRRRPRVRHRRRPDGARGGEAAQKRGRRTRRAHLVRDDPRAVDGRPGASRRPRRCRR